MRTYISGDEIKVTTIGRSEVRVLPVLVRGVGGRSERRTVFPVAIAGPAPTVTPGGVADYIPLSPVRPSDQARYGGGAFLLRLGRPPLLWERLPQGQIRDSIQFRMVAAGQDGTLYLMLVNAHEVVIYRRP